MAKADDMKAQDVHANETQFTQEQRSRADRRQSAAERPWQQLGAMRWPYAISWIPPCSRCSDA